MQESENCIAPGERRSVRVFRDRQSVGQASGNWGRNRSSEGIPVPGYCGPPPYTRCAGQIERMETKQPKTKNNSGLEKDGSPFQRRSKIQRTPPTTPLVLMDTRAEEAEKQAKQNSADTENPSPIFKDAKDILRFCRGLIKTMKTAADRQKNMAMEVKSALPKLEEAFDALESLDMRLPETCHTECKRTQFTQTVMEETRRGTGEKRTASSPADGKKSEKKKKEADAQQEAPEKSNGAWQEVTSRRQIRQARRQQEASETPKVPNTRKRNPQAKKRQPRPRPEAVLIKPQEGKSYAQVLGEIRKQVKPEALGTDIRSVRRTRSGDVLLELDPKASNKAGLCEVLTGLLGNSAAVRTLEPRTTLEFRDLDCLTTEEEVAEAIRGVTGDQTGEVKVRLSKPNTREQKMAFVEMTARGAAKLLEAGKVRIGWVYSRVRRQVSVVRCYACFGFGHRQADCKGPDRKKMGLCIQCGEKGHLKKDCKEQPKCCICKEHGLSAASIAHVVGSKTCQAFRQAMEKSRNNNR